MRAHLERRVEFALSGFGDQVELVVVRLSAESTRASPLKRCEIEVVLTPRSVRVAETGVDLLTAVENAAARLKRSVARALERDRNWSGKPVVRPLVKLVAAAKPAKRTTTAKAKTPPKPAKPPKPLKLVS